MDKSGAQPSERIQAASETRLPNGAAGAFACYYSVIGMAIKNAKLDMAVKLSSLPAPQIAEKLHDLSQARVLVFYPALPQTCIKLPLIPHI